jgi:hypothetical protein
VRVESLDGAQRGSAVHGGLDAISFHLERPGHQVADVLFIVHDEHALFHPRPPENGLATSMNYKS